MPLINRTQQTPTYIDAIRWVEISNSSGEEIPSFALVRVSGVSTENIISVAKPNSDGQDVLINGPTPIPINGKGMASRETPIHAIYDTGDGTPANGETWGSGNASWKLRKTNSGFTIAGGVTNGRVSIIRSGAAVISGGSVVIKEADGSPSYSAISELQFDQTDGFVVSQPGAGQARVDISATSQTQAGIVALADQKFGTGRKTVDSLRIDAASSPSIEAPVLTRTGSGYTLQIATTTSGGDIPSQVSCGKIFLNEFGAGAIGTCPTIIGSYSGSSYMNLATGEATYSYIVLARSQAFATGVDSSFILYSGGRIIAATNFAIGNGGGAPFNGVTGTMLDGSSVLGGIITAIGSTPGPAGPTGPTGATGPGYLATSATSLEIGTGSKTFTTQSGLAYTAGARVRASYTSGTTNYMEGLVTSYGGTSLIISMDHTSGSGTYANWDINLAGDVGAIGVTGAAGRDPLFKYTYNSNTANSDPGTGKLKFNNASFASATLIRISETDGDGNDLSAYIATWINSTSEIQGTIYIFKDGAPSNFAIFQVSSEGITDSGSYDTLAIIPVTSGGTISDNDVVKLFFISNGDAGLADAAVLGTDTPNATPRWFSLTKTYTDFSDASATKLLALPTLGTNVMVHAEALHVGTVFSGGGVATAVMTLGTSAPVNNAARYIASSDVKTNATYFPGSLTQDMGTAGGGAIAPTVTLTVDGGHATNQLTQGSVTISFMLSVIP